MAASEVSSSPVQLDVNDRPPNEAYTDPGWLVHERRTVLRSTWQFAGRASAVPEPGDAVPATVAGAPVLLLRDEDRGIRAFENVCPHRGTRLVPTPCQGLRTIVCPYHSWSFRLDGSLIGRPHFHGADRHDRADGDGDRPGLWPVRHAQWFDWIFVNLDGRAAPLDEVLQPFTSLLEGSDFQGCVYGGELEFDVAANWKLAHENFLDVLHKFKIHPELERAAPLRTNGEFPWHGDVAVTTHVLERPEDGRGASLPPLPGLTEAVSRLGVAAHLFPNTNIQLWRDQLVLFVCDALAPERTHERFLVYFAEDAMTDALAAERQAVMDTWDHLNRQDLQPLEWMQAGRWSEQFDGGTFSPRWDPPIVGYLNRLARATRS